VAIIKAAADKKRAFVQFTGVSLSFGERDILKNANLYLDSQTRASLCGANGAGKTTLLRVIAGLLPPDSGERAVEKGCRISYLPQSGITHHGETLASEAERAFSEYAAMLEAASCAAGEGRLSEQQKLLEIVEASGYYRRDAEISRVLRGLGFSEKDLRRPCGEFSGGWQMRIALAKTLLQKPDILLLDEPTNYLDLEARNWLENALSRFPGGVLLVSHDRYFLDVTVREVYDLFQGSLKRYTGNYSAYEKTREGELASLKKAYEAQQEEIARLEGLIERFRYKASKAAFAQEQIKKLNAIRENEIVLPESLKKISITLPPPPHCGRIALTVEGLRKTYLSADNLSPPLPVIQNLNLTLETGERLVVVGANGAGKTTLLRILAQKDSGFEGKVRYGEGVKHAYFSQDSMEALRGTETVLEYLENDCPTALVPKARDMLGAFLFRGDDVYKKIDVLSGGEKSRLSLLRLLLRPVNLLILDEPTNHLDLASKDILLDALRKYTGTVIFVSHDRAFMEALSTKTLEMRAPLPPRLFYGNYEYYAEKVMVERDETLSAVNCQMSTAPSPSPPSTAEARILAKQEEARRRRQEREEAAILSRLESLEAEKRAAEESLSKPEIYSNAEKARATAASIASLTQAIAEETARWEEIAGAF